MNTAKQQKYHEELEYYKEASFGETTETYTAIIHMYNASELHTVHWDHTLAISVPRKTRLHPSRRLTKNGVQVSVGHCEVFLT